MIIHVKTHSNHLLVRVATQLNKMQHKVQIQPHWQFLYVECSVFRHLAKFTSSLAQIGLSLFVLVETLKQKSKLQLLQIVHIIFVFSPRNACTPKVMVGNTTAIATVFCVKDNINNWSTAFSTRVAHNWMGRNKMDNNIHMIVHFVPTVQGTICPRAKTGSYHNLTLIIRLKYEIESPI